MHLDWSGMQHLFLPMNLAYMFTLATIVLSLVALIPTLCANPFTRRVLKQHAAWILLAIALALIAKYPFRGDVFSGLEYEDAYVYNAAARYALNNKEAGAR